MWKWSQNELHEFTLIIFVKAARSGTVKTRLAKDLGDEAACAAYRQLVEDLLNHLGKLSKVELHFTPKDSELEIKRWLRQGWTLQPQGEGDLGTRLQKAFGTAFARGSKRVVIIGSDCPYIVAEDIRQAWAALEENQIVIGPATDGGYWLIGLREEHPQLFTGISWSTNVVCETTLARAKAAGLRVKILRELTDVDTAADWQQFLNQR